MDVVVVVVVVVAAAAAVVVNDDVEFAILLVFLYTRAGRA